MKREFLKNLNLDNEVIDKIMSCHGEDIEKYKSQLNELEQLKKDLKNRDEQLESLKNSTANIDELKKQIETLQNENKTNSEKYQAELKQIKINNAVEKELRNANAKNSNVVMPLLNEFLNTASLDDKGNVIGLAEEIKKLSEAEETKFLFGTNEQKMRGIIPGQNSENTGGFIDQASFDANKNNPDWINRNWETISLALKEGTIKK